ncbi:hypothetical protein C8F04DRAFT_963603 [Mycena alexandri]|uniref:SNF5-domain-containing protein n=1 Tax=Mycena alexandri TaxID=1745969 RepID=A0AAD6SKR6_9AGAR|nr:hypothetical protein C8F04DRAFT_963603 [Mycena alexandri]
MPPSAARPPPPQPLLPPLPASVNLNPAVTRVTVVPLATSLAAIPPVSAEEIADVKEWMAVDRAYELRFREMKTRMGAELREIVGPRAIPWWEKGTLDTNASRFLKGRERFDVRYPYRKKDKDREYHHRKGARREGIRLPRKIDAEDANRPEQLVPIRLEFDVEHHKMRDTFVWNLNDPVISPEDFAQTVVEDYNLASSYHGIITKAIQDQLSDYRAHSANYDGDSWDVAVTEDTLRAGTLEGESAAWWSAWRKRLRSGRAAAGKGHKHKRRKVVLDEEEDDDMEAADERPMAVEDFTFDQRALTDDMRILVKLDIIVGSIKLDDQFEWDLDNSDASPEGFADIYAKELGLGGEFKTAIAHSIREQVQTYQKSLFLVGRPTDGSPVQDDDLRNALMPSLSSASRAMDQVQGFTPQLNYLSDGELERNEKERDKDLNRRRKRTRGGRRGVALPDREPIRTCRTPSIGFPELDAATLAVVAAATAPTRRAAAAAASVTIANMVASENGERDYTPTSSLPVVPMPPPLVIKEKTAKGFFKPPPYDTSVLRPRAKVRAPIESTAADISKLPPPLENDPPPAPTSSVVPPGKAVGLKRGRDDRVFADGQRRNLINGVWHCSNCGCPESIAVGRRKGPLGDKSQCGTCGKYWHRHRRPRPIDYNSDLEHHATLKRAAEYAKTMAKRKGGAAALRAQGGTVPATPADTSEDQTPRDTGEGPSRQSPARELSPISDTSSASEAPLAQTVKINGANHANITPPLPLPPKQEPAPVDPSPPANLPAPDPAPMGASASNPPPDSKPPAASLPPPLPSPPVSAPTLASAPSSKPVSVSAAPPTPTVAPPPPPSTQSPTQPSAPVSVAGPTPAADGSPVPPPSPRATWVSYDA